MWEANKILTHKFYLYTTKPVYNGYSIEATFGMSSVHNRHFNRYFGGGYWQVPPYIILHLSSLNCVNILPYNLLSFRLIATLLVFCLTAIVLFASIIYAIKPLTRCTGFVFLFLVAFFLAVWWLLGSLAFSADIALADFCISPNPDKFIQSQTTIDPQYKVNVNSIDSLWWNSISVMLFGR